VTIYLSDSRSPTREQPETIDQFILDSDTPDMLANSKYLLGEPSDEITRASLLFVYQLLPIGFVKIIEICHRYAS
jgi:hypothetical protein